ncbi:ribonuclease E inhibitor RraB [Solimonas sp. SE-A11]|uniref:ribonuclease E inhibitor RraB n=1 Tax=Solimonas sp. SE-A11 TaxID=3054954 RepID=UPI00259C85F3|nr:ribonuclease E inhibitor RraB [Solimonas sp. SE-A11]MDM4770116.1 ribonuclease E inhibitor RraB [Solimonas sp. SE-A11]
MNEETTLDGEDNEREQNRLAVAALEDNGDDLATPREIDHFVYFDDLDGLTRFEQQAEGLGFRVRHHVETEEGRPGLQVYRIDIPSFEKIDEITLPLYRAALDCGGQYDGWESQVVE